MPRAGRGQGSRKGRGTTRREARGPRFSRSLRSSLTGAGGAGSECGVLGGSPWSCASEARPASPETGGLARGAGGRERTPRRETGALQRGCARHWTGRKSRKPSRGHSLGGEGNLAAQPEGGAHARESPRLPKPLPTHTRAHFLSLLPLVELSGWKPHPPQDPGAVREADLGVREEIGRPFGFVSQTLVLHLANPPFSASAPTPTPPHPCPCCGVLQLWASCSELTDGFPFTHNSHGCLILTSFTNRLQGRK